MAISLNDAIRNVLANAFGDDFNSGFLRVYNAGSGVPADATVALTDQVLLADIALPADAFGAAAAGVIAKSGTWDDQSIDASGTAAFFRLIDSGGTHIVQGTVTVSAGGGDMEVDDVNFVAGGVFTVTSFSVTMPAA